MASLADALRSFPEKLLQVANDGGLFGEWLRSDAEPPMGNDVSSGASNLESMAPWLSLEDSGHFLGTGIGQVKEGLSQQFGGGGAAEWSDGMQNMLAGVGNSAIGASEVLGPLGAVAKGTAVALPAFLAMNKMAGNEASRMANLFPNQSGKITGRGGNHPKMTREEAEREGFWHPIGNNKKLNKPFGEMSRTVVDTGTLQAKKKLDLEKMQGGIIIPGTGDRSDVGKILTHVGDNELSAPVKLEGGPHFTRGSDEAAWASGKGVVSSIQKKANAALDEGKDPFLMYMPMGHGATDFNTMMPDAIFEQIRGNTSKAAKKDFDKILRKVRPEWKGIDNPESLEQLNSVGDLRRAFVSTASLKHFDNKGFPDIEETRFAITDPNLMDTPSLQGGQVVSKLTGNVIDAPKSAHSTYPVQLEGDYVGGIDEGVPLEIMFPDFYKSRRAINAPENRDHRSFDLKKPVQMAHQEWLDGLIRYLDGL